MIQSGSATIGLVGAGVGIALFVLMYISRRLLFNYVIYTYYSAILAIASIRWSQGLVIFNLIFIGFAAFMLSIVSSTDFILCIDSLTEKLLESKALLDHFQQDKLNLQNQWHSLNFGYVTNPETQLNSVQLAEYKYLQTEGTLAANNVKEQASLVNKLQTEINQLNTSPVIVNKRNVSQLGDVAAQSCSKRK